MNVSAQTRQNKNLLTKCEMQTVKQAKTNTRVDSPKLHAEHAKTCRAEHAEHAKTSATELLTTEVCSSSAPSGSFVQKCSTADECAEDIGAAAKAGAVSRSLKLQAEEKVISSSYVTHEIPKEINTSHLPQHHAGFLLTKSGQDSHNGGVTEAKEQKIPPVPIKDSVPNKPRENVRSEGMEYTIYNRERMLGVREHMGKTHTQKAPKLRTIQNERLIRFVEACVRKLNKKHDKETLNMLRGAYASGNTNKHTYKSSFVNITNKHMVFVSLSGVARGCQTSKRSKLKLSERIFSNSELQNPRSNSPSLLSASG